MAALSYTLHAMVAEPARAGYWSPRFLLVGLGVVLLAGCTDYQSQRLDDTGTWPTKPGRSARAASGVGSAAGRHLVLTGETLSELAERYDVPMQRLIAVNRVKKPYHIFVGQVLTVPGGTVAAERSSAARELATAPVPQRRPVQVAALGVERFLAPEPEAMPAQDEATREATRRAASRTPPALTGDGFLWPIRGRVLDAFGEKPSGARNDGINIAAIEGAPVKAAENGIVVYAGNSIPGFGRMLLVRHAGGFTTAYAHNSALFVKVGDQVERGQVIAHVGNSGSVASPQLHFEMRLGRKPVDPARHLTHDTQVASS